MNTKNFWKIELAVGLAGIILLGGALLWAGGLRFNLTPSLPKGLYRLTDVPPRRDDMVTFCLAPENPFCGLARERGYLHPGSCPSGLQPLLKQLVGVPGDHLVVTPAGLVLNGVLLPGTIRPNRDSQGRALPPTLLISGPIPEGLGLVLSQEHAGSFDGRHFGLVPLDLLQTVKPVWVINK